LYQSNLEISQAFYSSLSILEVSLRNSIHEKFKKHYGKTDWYNELPTELKQQVIEVEKRLIKSRKEVTTDRIIAELNFGFWTTLFNRNNAKFLWKPLLKSFSNIPNDFRKRTKVSASLNRIRTFRNRIYHYEPIIWDIQQIIEKRKEIFEILNWIEPDTEKWAKEIDTFDLVRKKIKNNLNK
jgi:uncharacterized coiled-coil DUF342 family protein